MKKKFGIAGLTILTAFILTSFMTPAFADTNVIMEATPPVYITNQPSEFVVNVTVFGVSDLFGWEFKLGYNSSLTVKQVQINGQFPWFDYTKGNNYLLVAGSLLGSVTPLSGEIMLVSITFQASGPGEYAFNLFNTKLSNNQAEPIPHQVVDGVPYLIHDIALVKLESNPCGWVPVPQGDPIYINVTIKNNGNFTETFPIYIYADRYVNVLFDELIVANTTVSLKPGEISTVNLVWNTTNTPYGTYYISAKASITDNVPANNIIGGGSFIGGICRPWEPREVDWGAFLISIVSSAALVGLFAVIGVSLFRALGAVRMPHLLRRLH